MTSETTYEVKPAEERNGIFVKYLVLFLAIIILVVVVIVIILLVYFLHPGWACPAATTEGDLPVVAAKAEKLFDGRLSDNLQPVNYRAKFTPYLDEEDGDKRNLIDGEVRITVDCSKPTDTITLHALELDIDTDSVTVTSVDGGDNIALRDFTRDEEYDFFTIKASKKLEGGKQYHVSMNYVARMNNTDLAAFYLNVYEENGETKYAMASQLETLYARRVLPCFDEPALKATFDVIIKHRTKRWALSNMPNIRNETEGEWNTAYFDTSPIMPTYLLAAVVSDFVCKEATTKNGVQFRVWAPESAINATDFALEFGVAALELLEELWQIPYPLPKLDMVSLPMFKFGAMENWGLVLYKHSRMLYDEKVNTPERARRVAALIAHELAHKWFGNLVTMGWWNASWLNEGFARHVQYITVDTIKPEWDIYKQFYQYLVTFKAMDNDASSDSHPTVQANIGFLKDTWSQFDNRVYERGSHLIWMLRSFLGDDVVFDAFRAYLNKYSYGNAFSDDLWFELTMRAREAGMDIDVQEVMDPWILKLGFPLVTVTRGDVYSAEVTQQFFRLDPDDDIEDSESYTWHIPLTFIHSGRLSYDNPTLVWMNNSAATLDLSDASANDWILANVYQHGYYRVNYDDDNWDKLINALNTDATTIPVQNRAALIDDAFNLARSGDGDVVLAFRIIRHLKDEENLSPWKAAIKNLRYVRDMLEVSPSYGNLQTFVRDLVKPRYEELGWNFADSDTQLEYHLRVETIKLSCELNNGHCVQEARDMYYKWIEDKEKNSIRDDIRATVMCTAIKHGDYEEWKFAYEAFANATDDSLQSDIALALACTPRVWLLNMYLSDFLQRYKNDSSERIDELVGVTTILTLTDPIDFYKIGGNVRDQSPGGYLLTWKFVESHFEELRSIDEAKAFKFVWGFAKKMNTLEQQKELEDFARKYNDMPDSQVSAFYKALRQVKANIKLMQRNYGKLEEWLKQTVDP